MVVDIHKVIMLKKGLLGVKCLEITLVQAIVSMIVKTV